MGSAPLYYPVIRHPLALSAPVGKIAMIGILQYTDVSLHLPSGDYKLRVDNIATTAICAWLGFFFCLCVLTYFMPLSRGLMAVWIHLAIAAIAMGLQFDAVATPIARCTQVGLRPGIKHSLFVGQMTLLLTAAFCGFMYYGGFFILFTPDLPFIAIIVCICLLLLLIAELLTAWIALITAFVTVEFQYTRRNCGCIKFDGETTVPEPAQSAEMGKDKGA